MARLRKRRRWWQAAICPGEPHAGIEPGIAEWDIPFIYSWHTVMKANAQNRNILVRAGRESNCDSVSNGE